MRPQQSEIKNLFRAVGARCANVRLQGHETRSNQRSKSYSAPLALVAQTGDSKEMRPAAVRDQNPLPRRWRSFRKRETPKEMKPQQSEIKNHIPRRWRSLCKRETPKEMKPQQSEIKNPIPRRWRSLRKRETPKEMRPADRKRTRLNSS